MICSMNLIMGLHRHCRQRELHLLNHLLHLLQRERMMRTMQKWTRFRILSLRNCLGQPLILLMLMMMLLPHRPAQQREYPRQ
jgi:hypothetical protein